ncbi:hemerythrin domain-containing protein [Planomonospora venezuelensis]|uniref:Hemerythrin-like domain-containing protein n=1 Tax=Planomonospora venezuelensis TaxID=1999 RepID=A0A841D200_PLAVE|nr:hemerythrin domain-containing protein [Planomonospora venezuelensis]MBB5963013.1 hypothetical protein [Planomonospora venezuelensis]GIN00581.1 hypothetical protein Pve01_22390 [Planomonospora venezuelensis]
MTATRHPGVPQIVLPGQAAAVPGPLDMTNMYLAHYGFRRDLGRLLVAAGRVGLADRARITALHEHLTWVLLVLHHHHTAEDETVWPRLRRRAPEAAEVIDALEAEHAEADRWIGESETAFAAFAARPTEEGRARLVTALRSLGDVLGAHLAHEETEGIPLMMAHITPEEDAEGHKGIQKEYGLSGMLKLVPWITSDLPPEVEEHLRRTAPKGLLLVNRLVRRRYERRMAYLWG